MKKFSFLKKMVVFAMAINFIMFAGIMVPVANAAMMKTSRVIDVQQKQIDKAQLIQHLSKQETREIFTKLGVSPEKVEQRIDQMTAEELAYFNQKAEKLPAGGVDVVGIVVLFAIIFIITDLIGATDIYPFINEI